MNPRERAETYVDGVFRGRRFGGQDMIDAYLAGWRAALEAALEKERKVSMGVCGGGGPLNQPHPTYIRPADIRALLEEDTP